MIQRLLSHPGTRPLPADEQLRLIVEYRESKDPRIEKRLVETNLRLVAKIAHQLDRTRGRSFDDLFSEGCVGLVEGLRRFDPAQGARLSTYAAFWIRAYIHKYKMDNVRIVRAVRTRAERAAFFRGIVGATDVSWDAPVARDRAPLGELIADPAPAPDRRLERAELTRKARAAARSLERRLNGRDLTILRQRVLADEPIPLRAVARRVAVSGERIRQIELNLKAAIRDALEGGSGAAAA
ncbi:MAG TPA: sigma-70 family RNA polymerase sigma factor [Polyangia bacterium]|nr:sigma-70 family RNA polymerase sigma factor [Polyangia bacterium]